MATYKHGVYTSEQATSMTAPVTGTAGLQVVVGTAPVNMLEHPEQAVNTPLLVYNYKEAVAAVGYHDNFAAYTLCESISAAFSVVGTGPLVLINVLDPAKHTADIAETTVQVNSGVAVLDAVGVLLDKLTVEEMPASSRRYPFVGFTMERECGKEILAVEGLSKTVDGRKVLDNVSFRVNKGDKIAFVGEDELAKTTLFKIIMGELEPDEGTYKWGTTITTSYFPLDNSAFFNDCDLNLVDWLAQFTPKIPEANTESFKRAFLGRMLFSGDDVFKPVKVLSGGEKVRCMLSRMMLSGANVLLLDQPTNHLDLESITALNNGLIDFKGVILFATHDHQFMQTVANRVIELTPNGCIDRMGTYEDYLAFKGLEV